MGSAAEVRVDSLVVEYGGGGAYPVRPIDGFSARVPQGSLALLLGPSGCGKTTLLACLGAILRPTAGTIAVNGTEVHALGGRELVAYRQRCVGIVFQAFNLVPSLTAVENVMAPMRAAGTARKPARARAEELLRSVGLAERLRHKPAELSGGQQQRIAIARALALDAPLILADEPTAHLDYVQVEGVLRLLRSLADEGRTVIVSTHDERMVPLADQVMEMRPSEKEGTVPLGRRHVEAGEIIFRQGRPGNEIFVVEEGEVDIVREHGDGTEEHLVTRRAGEFFGEMGPLFRMPRSATARARSASKLTVHTASSFRELIGDALPAVIGGGTSRVR